MLIIVCETAQQLTDAFEKIWNQIDRFDWHLYPYALLRMLPTIMNFAQQPVDIEFFGGIACNRLRLRKVRMECENAWRLLQP